MDCSSSKIKDYLMNKKILLTGSSGFIGKNLTIYLLEKKYHVYAILNNKKQNKLHSNRLKKKYKNYNPIFIDDINQIKKKVVNLNTNILINLASRYLRGHNFSQMIDLINSNILFTTSVLEAFPKNRLKKYINLSSVMIHKNSEEYHPQNLYAATKKSFLDILKFYQIFYNDIKFYNLFLHDIYGENDYRDKIIHTIVKNQKITINYLDTNINLEIVSLEPYDICRTTEIDLNVDFEPIDEQKNTFQNTNSIKDSVDSINDTLKKKEITTRVNSDNLNVLSSLSREELRKKRLDFYNNKFSKS